MECSIHKNLKHRKQNIYYYYHHATCKLQNVVLIDENILVDAILIRFVDKKLLI